MKQNKVMEAPEKIYIHPDIGDRGFLRPWFRMVVSNESIEYIRPDAFIEKACEFIETYPYLFMGHLRSEVIEDFKNYLKKSL